MRLMNRLNQFLEIIDEQDLSSTFTNEVLDKLIQFDYFNKPGAKSHHHNYEGGLYIHSLEVSRYLVKVTEAKVVKWKRKESPWIIGMLHDLCKCDDYIIMPNGIIMNPSRSSGHGDKSVRMIKELGLKLTKEEEYCILEHMGVYIDSKLWTTYNNHVRMYPNILYTHLADMVSSQNLIELNR